MGDSRPWTPEDDSIALDTSLTAREAAARLGRTIPAVSTRRSKLGFKAEPRGWSAEDDRIVLDSRRTIPQIARELGRNYQTIVARRKKLGGAPRYIRRRAWTPEEDAVVLDATLTVRKIATCLGVSRDSVTSRRQELGIAPSAQRCALPEHAEALIFDDKRSATAAARSLGLSRDYVLEQRRRAAVDEGVVERERQHRAYRELQATTRESATRHGSLWTGPQMELAARDDLTAKEVARMTGRTYAAVTNMRRKMGRGDAAPRILDGEDLY